MDATAWNERYSGTDLIWSATPNRWLVQELEGARPGKALDVASGEGRNAIWLAEQGWSVTAVDFADQAIARARSLSEQAATQLGVALDIEWVHDDVLHHEFRASAYDLVLACYLQLEDFDRREVMRSCAHALAPGGILLVIGHDSRNLAEGYGGPQDPSVLFTARDIEQDLQDHIRSGTLVVERSDRVAREVETDEGTRVAWDALFRARGRKMSETFQFG